MMGHLDMAMMARSFERKALALIKKVLDMDSKNIIYLQIDESVKQRIELLKETMDKDSNDVYYSVMSEYVTEKTKELMGAVLKAQKVPAKVIDESLKTVAMTVDKATITKAFAEVDIEKLRAQVIAEQFKKMNDELAKKFGIKPEEVEKIRSGKTEEPPKA